jgi:hypothetical protein
MLPQFLYKSYNQVPDNGIRLRSDLDFAGALHHASCRSCEVTAALEDVLHQIELLS